jgi:hypothetical protein
MEKSILLIGRLVLGAGTLKERAMPLQHTNSRSISTSGVKSMMLTRQMS